MRTTETFGSAVNRSRHGHAEPAAMGSGSFLISAGRDHDDAVACGGVAERAGTMDKHAPYRIARVVRWGAALATAFLMGIVGTTEAVSANFPHFKSFSVTISTDTATTTARAAAAAASADLPDLLFTWTEVGVGAPDVTYELRSVVTATFGCVNSGSNQPHGRQQDDGDRPGLDSEHADVRPEREDQRVRGAGHRGRSAPVVSPARRASRWWRSRRRSRRTRSPTPRTA